LYSKSKIMRLKTLSSKVKYRIAKSKDKVFLLSDFDDLSDRDQIGRILRSFVKEQELIKIGQGLYAKARYSDLFNKVMPIDTLADLTKEALIKLGVKTYPTSFERAYNEYKSTQVPTGRVVGVKNRITRKIRYEGREVVFEYVS
jgi:hypothetical protein